MLDKEELLKVLTELWAKIEAAEVVTDIEITSSADLMREVSGDWETYTVGRGRSMTIKAHWIPR